MRLYSVMIAIMFVFLSNSDPYAGTIYSWKDKNGIQKFSNTAPGQDVEHFEVIEEIPLSETGNTDIKGVEEQPIDIKTQRRAENKITDFSTKQEPGSPQEQDKSIHEQFNAKIQSEKTRLQGEIDRIDKLAVGRSLSLARKNAMIKQFQDKLNLLEKSPEKYFEIGDTD